MRFATFARFCLFALAPAACSSGSGLSVPDTTRPPLVLASCDATFELVETDPPGEGTMYLVTAGDTLLYSPDGSTLLAYSPGSSGPRTLVSGGDALGYFWVDGSTVMWTTDRSFWQVPLTGGAPTAFLTPAIYPDVMPDGRILTHDADAIYGATVLDSVAAAENPTITVFRQPFRCSVHEIEPCGQVQTLATLSVSPEALLSQLFDAGDSVLLGDSGGEVFSIPKDGRPATRVASNLNASAAFLFAPDGPSAFYASLQDTDRLVSLALADGSQTPLWPSTQPTLAATSLALDATGAAFVAGTAFVSGGSASSPPQACPAYGWVPPGGSGALLGCGAYCGGLSDTQIVTLVAGDTVLYAKTFSAGTWGIVRLPKQG
jgi:hypothetical protein